MRLLVLLCLTMVAFAANSVLNRVALADDHIDPASFGTLRLFSGAAMLAAMTLLRDHRVRLFGPYRAVGVLALLGYIYGFSAAYNQLDAGVGALILFGLVQLTMFTGGLIAGERPPGARWAGAALALAGLAWLLWPGSGTQISPLHAGFMAIAGISWGVYSLAGRRAGNALQATAANFILAAPVGLLLFFSFPAPGGGMDNTGIALAVASGAVTSGLGYALWYSLLPQITATTAAIAQLTVPMIAIAGGAIVLSEALTLQFAFASLVVLAGVALSALPRRG